MDNYEDRVDLATVGRLPQEESTYWAMLMKEVDRGRMSRTEAEENYAASQGRYLNQASYRECQAIRFRDIYTNDSTLDGLPTESAQQEMETIDELERQLVKKSKGRATPVGARVFV